MYTLTFTSATILISYWSVAVITHTTTRWIDTCDTAFQRTCRGHHYVCWRVCIGMCKWFKKEKHLVKSHKQNKWLHSSTQRYQTEWTHVLNNIWNSSPHSQPCTSYPSSHAVQHVGLLHPRQFARVHTGVGVVIIGIVTEVVTGSVVAGVGVVSGEREKRKNCEVVTRDK